MSSISSGVSLLGETTSQINRLSDLRTNMDTLEAQISTGQEDTTFSELGNKSSLLQTLTDQVPLLQSYLQNNSDISSRMTAMSNALTQITQVGTQLVSSLQNQGGQTSIQSINQQAQQDLSYVESLINQTYNGQYVFAGSNTSTPPFVDNNTLNTNFQNQISTWLSGSTTNAQLTANVSGFTATNLGLSPALATAGNNTAKIDNNVNIDYTVNASQPAFQDVIRALTFAANLQYPGPADVPTAGQYNSLVSTISGMMGQGVQEITATNNQLAANFNLLNTTKTNQTADLNTIQTQVSNIENADPATAIATLQQLQTQLTSSYEATKIISQLSLVNYMP